MTPALTLTRPAAAPRFPWPALWLLALVPANGVVLFDLAQHVVRPTAWLARFVPALVVLGVVGWTHFTSSPAAIRVRKELRLAQLLGLPLLLISGLGLWWDVMPDGGAWALARFLPWGLSFILPAATLMTSMTVEDERGTLAGLLSSPLGARAFAEKFGVTAGLVVISWSQLAAASPSAELGWVALLGHAAALATVPTWFFLMRKVGTTLGAAILVPLFIAAPAALLGHLHLALGCVSLYALVMLALLPRAARRGVMAPPLDDQLSLRASSLPPRLFPPLFAAELNVQRDALVMVLVGTAAFLGLVTLDGATEAPMAFFVLCAMGAALSPGLAFAEAQRLGTLETLLVMRPRSSVFLLKALVSFAATMVAGGVLPVVLMSAAGVPGMPSASGAWFLAIAFVWSMGLVAAVHTSAAAQAMSAAVGLVLITFVAQMASFAVVALTLSPGGSSGAFVAAIFAGTTGIAVFLAWRRFVLQPEAPVRGALLGAGAALFHALALGVAAALSAW